jgi:aspartate racemase
VSRMERIVGVLGGMGPLATADFYAKMVRLTPARTDQDHLRVIIDSNPKIPDRSAGLAGDGPDPTPALVATAQALERAGAELIAIPCNSAHAYLPAIRRAVAIPVLDMAQEVAAAVSALIPRPFAVGLLATPGTIRTGLYHRALARDTIGIVDCTEAENADLLRVIKAVKAGDLRPEMRRQVREIANGPIVRGAEALILGCTEIPLVLGPEDVPVPVMDSTEILAAAAVREALRPGLPSPSEFPAPLGRSFSQSSPDGFSTPADPSVGAGKYRSGPASARRP